MRARRSIASRHKILSVASVAGILTIGLVGLLACAGAARGTFTTDQGGLAILITDCSADGQSCSGDCTVTISSNEYCVPTGATVVWEMIGNANLYLCSYVFHYGDGSSVSGYFTSYGIGVPAHSYPDSIGSYSVSETSDCGGGSATLLVGSSGLAGPLGIFGTFLGVIGLVVALTVYAPARKQSGMASPQTNPVVPSPSVAPVILAGPPLPYVGNPSETDVHAPGYPVHTPCEGERMLMDEARNRVHGLASQIRNQLNVISELTRLKRQDEALAIAWKTIELAAAESGEGAIVRVVESEESRAVMAKVLEWVAKAGGHAQEGISESIADQVKEAIRMEQDLEGQLKSAVKEMRVAQQNYTNCMKGAGIWR